MWSMFGGEWRARRGEEDDIGGEFTDRKFVELCDAAGI